ncbi:glycosyl transferase family 1 [Natrarchaeobaculum aegyptiacum]|uniref:Glycosyl transferase family 1 n=1 Tax=Natrarchaeobaculum aegyptiacum TaxID=745377 RepID=A0A2Z2HX57_9EURY|nr:glycosyl transferase family 1 [Natrarchaeobaculum aegyptiacum]
MSQDGRHRETDTASPANGSRGSEGEADETDTAGTAAADATPAADQRVLVVTGLGRKNRRHFGPLAEIAGETTFVALEPRYDVDGARYVAVPDVGPRLVRLVVLFVLALYEGFRNDYDAVVSISLFPYGIYALVLKAVYGYPTHLGVIGIDLDHHVDQWYGPVVRWLFGRFDAVSVPGTDHAERLTHVGVSPDRIEILTNAIDVDVYRPPESGSGEDDDGSDVTDVEYDFVWVGRLSPEKDPLRFVAALEVLADGREGEFRALIVGDGPLRPAVVEALETAELTDRVDMAGWVDDPVICYRRADCFVLTSERDALPLALLEAMATGLAPVVPPVGSVPDVVTDGENGLLVADRDVESIADGMARYLDEPAFRRELGRNAAGVRPDVSFEQASVDWGRILATLEG